jgi:hypothetical protein
MTTSAMQRGRSSSERAVRLTGWAITAASLLLVIGAINLINGYTLLDKDSYLRSDHIVYQNLDFWGWAFLIWGALQVVAGALVVTRRPTGTYMGLGLSAVGCVMWFFMIFAIPFGTLVGVILNMLILGGLVLGAVEGWNPALGGE